MRWKFNERNPGGRATGAATGLLEQQQPDHEPRFDPGPAILAVERRDLPIDPWPMSAWIRH